MATAAITTRYHGPTTHRGSRVKAIGRAGQTYSDGTRERELSLTDSWDHSSSSEENHCRVAKLFAAKHQWAGLYVAGGLPDGSGYVYVRLNAYSRQDLTNPHLKAGLEEAGEREGRDWFIVLPR
jgi:hypothetical protein